MVNSSQVLAFGRDSITQPGSFCFYT